MSTHSEKEKQAEESSDNKPTRLRGIGNPESHSQDADRKRKTEHPKSDK